MIDFTRAGLELLCVHYVGNKGLGEELTLSENVVNLNNDFLNNTVMRYFSSPFKDDIYYKFKGKSEFHTHDIKSYCEDLFKDKSLFIDSSKHIAEHLYNQTMHPKIMNGELSVAYFRDVMVDNVISDAIGIFKSETKQTYLKLNQSDNEFEFESENGINISKLDKGVLVFNIQQDNGYKVSVIDTNNKIADASFYWVEDFLNLELIENNYYHTQSFMHICKNFCDEMLTEENNVKKQQKMVMQNRSVDFLKEKENFNLMEFEKEVLVQPELIDAFDDYIKEYKVKMDVNPPEEFEISQNAVKKNSKIMKSVIKLDKTFVINVNASSDLMENGYDEDRGMKFYKVFYANEY
jgi:hypothetical protein